MNRSSYGVRVLAGALLLLFCGFAHAQTVPAQPTAPIIVPVTPPAPQSGSIHIKKIIVQNSPLSNSGIDIAKAAQAVQILGHRELTQNGAPDALRALQRDATGVNLDNAAGNPYQPSLFYHGFEISPLQGTSQGRGYARKSPRYLTAWNLV